MLASDVVSAFERRLDPVGANSSEPFIVVRHVIRGGVYDRAAEPGRSSQPLRLSRWTGGSRRCRTDGASGGGGGARPCVEPSVHPRADPAPHVPTDDALSTAVRDGL